MKWFIPREHGAWAMLIVPFMLGMFASGTTFLHFIFFIGVLAFYFSSGPLFAYIRKPKLNKEILPSLLIYVSIGLLFTVPLIYFTPKIFLISLFILPLFTLNIYFAKIKKERLFINDVIAITALSFLVIISYYLGLGVIDQKAIWLMLINIIFFTASVFHVKTLIREKGNIRFLWASHVFHGFTIILFLVIHPLVAFAFLIGAMKTWFMPRDIRYKPIQIGLIEIANSVLFLVIIGFFY
ncbi:hypothetical protein DS745_18200 [Anaerobacillus alkaliphilus]|uniref:YwiC-like family protein n=1 Tax=Anaerobacillus alkaliphilus TaxID=1548597 RepID=A0A4Q0VQS2_9BACI|nr:YwiC-like family protein [Anaerobacillus alkaliphilus]RXI98267.1 hypothetical protein DS745_18200 [Anaerobacillus alkaliphilus]